MKKIIAFLFIMTGILISCKSKVIEKKVPVVENKEVNYIPYYLKVTEADSLYLIGNYKRSYQILDSLFKKYEPLKMTAYDEYFTYYRNKVLLNDFDNIDKVLKKLVINYGNNIGLYLKDSLNNIAVKKANFSEANLKEFYETYLNNLNLDYRYAIEKMIEEDQRVRKAVPRNNEEWELVDNENTENIKRLISKYGYPSIKKIGSYNYNNKSSNIVTLFLHASKEERESYILDLMLESVKKGECEPTDFAVVYDKYLYSIGK